MEEQTLWTATQNQFYGGLCPQKMLRLAENVYLSETFAPDFYLKSVVLEDRL